jgi:hypothetical protein
MSWRSLGGGHGKLRVVVGDASGAAHLEPGLEGLESLGHPAHVDQQVGEVAPGGQHIRVQPDGLAVGGFGVFQTAGGLQRNPVVEVQLGHIGPRLDQLVKDRQGRLRGRALAQRHRLGDQKIAIAGAHLGQAGIGGGGLVEAFGRHAGLGQRVLHLGAGGEFQRRALQPGHRRIGAARLGGNLGHEDRCLRAGVLARKVRGGGLGLGKALLLQQRLDHLNWVGGVPGHGNISERICGFGVIL